jgi:hypothetical protein
MSALSDSSQVGVRSCWFILTKYRKIKLLSKEGMKV